MNHLHTLRKYVAEGIPVFDEAWAYAYLERCTLQETIENIVCPSCDHKLVHHVDRYGCEVERGDREGDESSIRVALPPCYCDGVTEDIKCAIRVLRGLR